ncbi:3-ketoacyl-ACP reductase [Steroidobacter denitrificans]|uniref:3-ketoacyl-ACP reductase n=1 Tax=Steroidobacter denitrificans TaxID=465721 RepID=A0A127FC46_STEDE|nr:SDR family NAD(P)-dependent oxidoreductase [Steroidobacter denitrificans]AMN47992.1 3-ketoacyl-ACP reductase [Steroidobacter denitrificans]
MRLKDKVAVITGAGSGIGRATAELFAAEGAAVLASDLNAGSLEETVVAIRSAGGRIIGVQGNVTLRAEAEAMIDQAIDHYGRIDVLVNNAGAMDYNHGVGSVPDDVWDRMLAVNLTGPMFTSRRAVQCMLTGGGGAIVNVASAAGASGAVAGAAYTSSKHGLIGLTRSTAWMYAQQNIRCNAILPGGVQTSIVSSMDPNKWDAEGTARVGVFHQTMPGILEPIDIALLALFLASDEARQINGALVSADGGWLAN